MAESLVYRNLGTPITFKDSDATYTLTLNNLAHGAGRVSDQVDRGAGSKPVTYQWKAVICWETAGVVGERVEIYIIEGDGTDQDGAIAAGDAAWSDANIKPNMKLIGINTTQATTGDAKNVASGICSIWGRYFAVAVWSNSAASHFQNDNDASYITLTPMPDAIQAEA